MTPDQFESWVSAERQIGRLTEAEASDLIEQRSIFDSNRDSIREFVVTRSSLADEAFSAQAVVGYQNGLRIVANSVAQLFEIAGQGSGMVYFEPVGYNPFGGGYMGDGGSDD